MSSQPSSFVVLGAGPECPTRPYCLPGLQTTYGIHFKDFKALDTDGPATRAAFKNGTIQVGLVFSSDGDLNDLGLVVLQDDKHLEAADNVVPISESRAMADVLGANAAYTEFPGVKHNSWDPAYETTGVVEWLVKQKRP